jgi:hypothetical protein
MKKICTNKSGVCGWDSGGAWHCYCRVSESNKDKISRIKEITNRIDLDAFIIDTQDVIDSLKAVKKIVEE